MSVTTKLTVPQLIALSQACKAASDDSSRMVLACLCIEVTPKHIYAVATDSYMIVSRHITEGDFGERMQILIPAKALTAAIKQATARRESEKGKNNRAELILRDVTLSADGITIGTPTGSINVAQYDAPEFKTNDGRRHRYPKWAELVQTYIDRSAKATPVQEIGLNPEFVGRIGDALGCNSNHAMRMLFLGGLHPVFVAPIGPDDKSFGLLMPIRLESGAVVVDNPRATTSGAKKKASSPPRAAGQAA